jgi:hypothetical protein
VTTLIVRSCSVAGCKRPGKVPWDAFLEDKPLTGCFCIFHYEQWLQGKLKFLQDKLADFEVQMLEVGERVYEDDYQTFLGPQGWAASYNRV